MGKSIKHNDRHEKIYGRDVSHIEDMMHGNRSYPIRLLPAEEKAEDTSTIVKGSFYDKVMARAGRAGFTSTAAEERANDISRENNGKIAELNKKIAAVNAKIDYYEDKLVAELAKIDDSADSNPDSQDINVRRKVAFNNVTRRLVDHINGELSKLDKERLDLHRELNKEIELAGVSSVTTSDFIGGFKDRSASRLNMIKSVVITKDMYKDILNKVEDELAETARKSEELVSRSSNTDKAAIDREYSALSDRLESYYSGDTAQDIVLNYLNGVMHDYYKECDHEYSILLGDKVDGSVTDKQAALIRAADESGDGVLRMLADEFGKEQALALSMVASKKALVRDIIPAISVAGLKEIKSKLSSGINSAVDKNEDGNRKEYAEDKKTYDSEEQLFNTIGYYGIKCYVKEEGTAAKYTWGNSGWRRSTVGDEEYEEIDVSEFIKDKSDCILYVFNSSFDGDNKVVKNIEHDASNKHIIYPNASKVKKIKIDVADVAVARKLSSIGINSIGLHIISKVNGYKPVKVNSDEKGAFQAAINESFLSYI